KTDPYSLYDTGMSSRGVGIARSGSSGSYTYSVINNSGSLPITYVGWGEAARFTNWLQNGQPTGAEGPGTTETGAYTLNPNPATELYNETRNAGATVFLPSEDEWYKAAYYNPATHSYNQYPFSSNATPISASPGSTPNTGNFFDRTTGYVAT